MKRTLICLLCLGSAMLSTAQTPYSLSSGTSNDMLRNNLFNHLDAGLSVGTSGIGFELSAPATEWVSVRMGGVFRPLDNKRANFGLEVAQGLSTKLKSSRFNELADRMEKFTGFRPNNRVQMEGSFGMNNFKFLVDVHPFQKSGKWYRNFYATVGFFWGNGTLIEAKNTAESMNTLLAVAMYNKMYRRALENKSPIDLDLKDKDKDNALNTLMGPYVDKLRRWGSLRNDAKGNPVTTTEQIEYQYWDDLGEEWITATAEVQRGTFAEHGISIPLGVYSRDVIAQQDIYYDYSEKLYREADVNAQLENPSIDFTSDEYHYQKDARGRYIKKGSIRYKKGEVMHRAGEEFRMVPDADNIIKATARTNKFKPYVGIGFAAPISKDKRDHIALDAGVMIWGGTPSIDVSTPIGQDCLGRTVTQTFDMTRDLTGFSPSVASYVKSVKRYPVFPEISIRVTHRLW